MRLIDADKIVVNTFRNNSDGYKMWKTDFDGLLNIIDEQPTVDVLDKIRTEIENDWQLKKYPSSPFSCGLRRAIEIIDKYKAEIEPQERSE